MWYTQKKNPNIDALKKDGVARKSVKKFTFSRLKKKTERNRNMKDQLSKLLIKKATKQIQDRNRGKM